MDIEIDTKKGSRDNLAEIYSRLRALKDKMAGLQKAISESELELAKAIEKNKASEEKEKRPSAAKAHPSKKEKKKWWGEYLSFITSGGRRVVAGGNAKQNDELVAKYLSENDLFFHADIQGAPTVILKEFKEASEQEMKEAAQFAASFSSAWKVGASAVDVYAVKSSQVSKHAMGGYVGRGAFAIEGERQWFRQTPLSLKIGMLKDEAIVLPSAHPQKLSKEVSLSCGSMPKEEACKKLSAHLSVKADEIAGMLPSGKYSISI